MRRLLCVEAPRTSDILCPTPRACTQGIPVQGSTYTQYHIAVDIFFRVWQSRGPQPPYLSLWKQNKTLGRHTVHHHLSPPLTPYLFPVPLPEDNSTVLRSGYRQRCPGPQAGDRGDRPRSGVGGHDTNYPRRQR